MHLVTSNIQNVIPQFENANKRQSVELSDDSTKFKSC
jgi:hypothetical protein